MSGAKYNLLLSYYKRCSYLRLLTVVSLFDDRTLSFLASLLSSFDTTPRPPRPGYMKPVESFGLTGGEGYVVG